MRREDFLKVIRLCTKIEWSAADEFSRTAISTWQDYWENKFVAGNDEKTVAPESLSIENEVSKRLALADAEYAVYKEGKPSFSQFGDHYDLDKENDDHWNDAGQELAARQTADYIYNNILSEVR